MTAEAGAAGDLSEKGLSALTGGTYAARAFFLLYSWVTDI